MTEQQLSREAKRAIDSRVRLAAFGVLTVLGLANVAAWVTFLPGIKQGAMDQARKVAEDAARQAVEEQSNEIESVLRANMNELESRIQDSRSQLANFGTRMGQVHEELGETVGRESGKLEQIQGRMAEMQSEVDGLSTNVSSASELANRVIEMATDLEGAKGLASLDRISRLAQWINEGGDFALLMDLERRIAALEPSIQALEEGLERVSTNVQGVQESVARGAKEHSTRTKWVRRGLNGNLLTETHSVGPSPDRHGKSGVTVHGDLALRSPNPTARVYKVEYKCLSGRACGWSYAPGNHRPQGEYGASFEYLEGKRGIKWGRHYTSGPVNEQYILYYEIQKEECTEDCEAEGDHLTAG